MRNTRIRRTYGGQWAAPACLIAALAFPPTRDARCDTSRGVVEGWVLHASGTPAAYANVMIVGTRGTRLGTQTDESGRFWIGSVPSGRWQILVKELGTPVLSDSIVIAGRVTLRRIFHLPASDDHDPALLRDSLRAIGRWPPRLDERLAARMREASDVRILRLDPSRVRHPPPPDTLRFVGPWPIVGEVRRPRPVIDALLPALGDTAAYVERTLGGIKPCGSFEPGIDVRFAGAGPPTDVLICYKCGEFSIRSRDGLAQAGDFAGNGLPFTRFAQAAFPNDPAFQALGRPRGD